MERPDLVEKDILNPSEAIEYFVLSRRKFYDLLNNTDGEDFLAYYGERKLILRVAFERYLRNHGAFGYISHDECVHAYRI